MNPNGSRANSRTGRPGSAAPRCRPRIDLRRAAPTTAMNGSLRNDPCPDVSLRRRRLRVLPRHVPLRDRLRRRLVVPKTIDSGAPAAAEAVVVNVLLLGALRRPAQRHGARGVQALVDAVVPGRSSAAPMCCCASLALILLFWQWRPIPQVVWSRATVASWRCWRVVLVGWALVLLEHVPDQPLRAVRAAARSFATLVGRKTPSRFNTPLLYKVVRHPIYLGFLIAFWATPRMTLGHLLSRRRRRPTSSSASGSRSAMPIPTPTPIPAAMLPSSRR